MIIGCTLQIDESSYSFCLKFSTKSCMTPGLCVVLSVINKSIFSTESFSVCFQPDEASNIFNVIGCKSFKLALVSEKMFSVGSAFCFHKLRMTAPHNCLLHFEQNHHKSMVLLFLFQIYFFFFVISARIKASTCASVLLVLLMATKVLYVVGSFLLYRLH